MDLSRESEQRSTFRNLLFLLAKKQDLLQDKQERIRIYKQLEDLYHPPGREERFRHFKPAKRVYRYFRYLCRRGTGLYRRYYIFNICVKQYFRCKYLSAYYHLPYYRPYTA